jgi:small subunit ribosomal protein S13
MLHIFGVNIPSNKSTHIALTSIYGIGKQRALLICKSLGISHEYPINQLNEAMVYKLCRLIEQEYAIETELRKNQNFNIKRLLDIKSYRGLRHAYGLPVNGQRTHTNARTQKALAQKRGFKYQQTQK